MNKAVKVQAKSTGIVWLSPDASEQARIATLPPRHLLRAVLEVPHIASRLFRCASCDYEVIVVPPPSDGIARCAACGGPAAPFGAAWWRDAARRIRDVCRRAPKLLRRVKAEWRARHGETVLPMMPPPFDWPTRRGRRPSFVAGLSMPLKISSWPMQSADWSPRAYQPRRYSS